MESNSFGYTREEDFVECFILPVTKDIDTGNKIIDNVYQDVCELVKTLCKGYIWHKDPFKLHKRPHEAKALYVDCENDLPSHIYGISYFGDNIDDEWFIVYVLKEITNKFHSLVARIVDSDGEFLLIEAANSLPAWASPNNCSNRVFLHKGEMILINPQSQKNVDEISVMEALGCLYSNRDLHVANSSIQKDISNQTDQYPDKVKKNFHTTTVFTPVGVATLLKENPNLISAAVHSFCNRDPIDMKVCRAMRYFPPENRVNTSVTFTRSLYAMLIHNNFNPDKRTGWNLPVSNSPQHKSHSLGAKLACGFEILISQASIDSDISNNRAWKDYVKALNNRNYFQGYYEGSKPYNELLQKAEDYFKTNLDYVKIGPQLGRNILDLLRELDVNEQEFRENESKLPDDDDDKWLCVDPKELENMMQERYGSRKFFPLNNDTEASEFSKKITDFLECQSGIDGVEYSSEPTESNDPIYSDIPVRPKRGIKKKKINANNPVNKTKHQDSFDNNSPSKHKIDFDADQFSSAIQNILDLVIPDDSWDLESDSDVSECGSGDEIETHIHKLATSESKEEDLMKQYMDQMDSELANTSIGKSFDVDGSSGKLDVDVNALKNMKQSMEEEMGGSGPVGNMLVTLGISKYSMLSSIDDEVD